MLAVIAFAGCASSRMTDTKRAGVEQLLVSNAIDSSLDKIDFDCLAGGAVFVDDKLLDCTDSNYIVGSVRQRAFEAGCSLVDKADQADIVLELYSGAVGTDRAEGFIGTPALSVPGPFPVQLPEVKLFSQTTQYGTAKLGLVAYDAKSKRSLSSGGLTRSRSTDSSWTVLGIGPFSSGSLRDEYALTKKLESPDQRFLLSDRPRPAGAPQFSTYSAPPNYPAPPLYNTPTELHVPGSLGARAYQPEPPPSAVGNLNVSRLPPWANNEANAPPGPTVTNQ